MMLEAEALRLQAMNQFYDIHNEQVRAHVIEEKIKRVREWALVLYDMKTTL